MQQAAERALERQLGRSRAGRTGSSPTRPTAQYMDSRGETTATTATTTTYAVPAGTACVTLEAKTGYIRAMVGGRDFDDSKFNRATQALRQPGSTFKPIVYAAAVEAGYPLSHVMVDDSLSVDDRSDAGHRGRRRTTISSSTAR